MTRNDVYIIHVCKNSNLSPTNENYCNNCWVDVDKTHATTYPPTWKYCKECEAKGFKNPKTRNITRTPEQIEAFKERMKEYRRKKNDENRETISEN